MKPLWLRRPGMPPEFAGGKSAFATAAHVARDCAAFAPDDEDEWAASEPRSCYNCRWRRWTAASFACLAKNERD